MSTSMAAIGRRIMRPRKTFIRKGAKCCFYAVAVLAFTSWSVFGLFNKIFLPSTPCTCISDLERQRAVANKARLSPISTVESHQSLQHSTANENTKGFTTEPQSRPFKHKTTLITRKACVQQYFLLILVTSAPSEVQRRRDIRKTWGVDTVLKSRWKTFFLVAQTREQNQSDSLLKEDETFGDLVWGGHYDHYYNLTLKTQMAFEWAARYCNFSFLLKVDDDVFVNTKALLLLLKEPSTPHENMYMGRDANRMVYRKGKFGVSKEEFNGRFYPPFCPGFGIVFSADVVRLFVDVLDVVPTIRLEDVYIGMLANKSGVKPIRTNDFEVNTSRQTRCKWKNSTLLRHGVTGNCLYELFNETYFH